MNKLVSVIIPTYKRPDTLPRAINSVLNQTYKNIEIIVVDDNDPDSMERKRTELVMEQYKKNKQIKYIRHPKNMNGSVARNTGFRFSKGEFVMFLDDDDEFLPQKVDVQVRCLKNKDSSWGACYTRYVRMKDGKVFSRSIENREGYLLIEELKRNLFVAAGSNLMIRRAVFEELGGFDESFARNQDQEFLTRLLLKYKLAYADTVGLIVHLHDNINKNNIDFDEITNQYLETFEDIISNLNDEDRQAVLRMINLQRFRAKLFRSSEWSEAVEMVKEQEVRIYDVLHYIMHLAYRRITKTSYGFQQKKNK